jgi:hypothetical protein
MRQEYPHNTPEQVREYLREGLKVIEELDPPEDLRESCFNAAVNLTAAKQIDDISGQGNAVAIDPRHLLGGIG